MYLHGIKQKFFGMRAGNVNGCDNKYKLQIVISYDFYGQAGTADNYQALDLYVDNYHALDLYIELLFHPGKKF
jgi:hypothetical protein